MIAVITDKYKVREYVSQKIGEEVLIPLLWVGKSLDQIAFDDLPKSFVLKCNEGSGKNYIVIDKTKIDRKEMIKKTQIWLKSNFSYMFGRERCYQNTERLLLIEKYIGSSTSLPVDYKFFMTEGKFILLEYCFSRVINEQRNVKIEYLDSNLNSFEKKSSFSKPINFDKMLKFAMTLSEKFKFVRVDFYSVDDKIFFGEMTLYPSSGWKVFPQNSIDEKLGEEIKLADIMIRKNK